MAVTNATGHPIVADPEPSPGLVPLDRSPDKVGPRTTADHDYVVAVDRFGNDYPWPSDQALATAGGFAQHFAHMRSFWHAQLNLIAEVHTCPISSWTTRTGAASSTPRSPGVGPT